MGLSDALLDARSELDHYLNDPTYLEPELQDAPIYRRARVASIILDAVAQSLSMPPILDTGQDDGEALYQASLRFSGTAKQDAYWRAVADVLNAIDAALVPLLERYEGAEAALIEETSNRKLYGDLLPPPGDD